MRCALVEFNTFHEEVLPTFVWLLNRLDIEPDVYLADRSARRGPFELSEGLRFRRRSADRIDRLWGVPFRLRRYDLHVVNSMEPTAILERAGRLRGPLVGVVHNADLLRDDPAYLAFFARPRRQPMVVGRHIADHLAPSLGPLPWMSHVVFGGPAPATSAPPAPDRPTTFAVSGNVEFHRRNYASLLDAASTLHGEGRSFRVRVVGRSTRPDGKALRREVEARGLSGVFEFSAGEIRHAEFFGLVGGSDFSVPLVDTSSDGLRMYLETKLASAVPFAIGLGVPLVAHTALLRAYGVEGCGIAYEDGGLADAMRAAIASTADDRASWREALAAARRSILDASLTNLRDAVAAVVS